MIKSSDQMSTNWGLKGDTGIFETKLVKNISQCDTALAVNTVLCVLSYNTSIL